MALKLTLPLVCIFMEKYWGQECKNKPINYGRYIMENTKPTNSIVLVCPCMSRSALACHHSPSEV